MTKSLNGCPICQSRRIKFFYRGRAEYRKSSLYDLSICEDCGHYFVNPVPGHDELLSYYNQAYPAYSRTLDETSPELEDLAAAARRTARFRNLAIRPGMKVLDVGCGGGLFLHVLKKAELLQRVSSRANME